MNSYNPYSGNKKKIFRNVVTVVICAAIIFGATVIFGNHLKKKANLTSDSDFAGVGREDIFNDDDEVVIPPPSEGAGVSVTLKGVCVPLGNISGGGDTDGDNGTVGNVAVPESFADALASVTEDRTGIVIPLTDSAGYLLYNSVAAGEFSRLPQNPTIPDTDTLAACVSSAKALGLRTVALISAGIDPSDSATTNDRAIETDVAIVSDAKNAGFDEIIITSLVSPSVEEMDGDGVTLMLKYLKNLTAAAQDMSVGIALPPEAYLDVTLSPRIELLMSSSVFLAMELDAEDSVDDYVTHVTEKLSGTLSVYNMRLLLSPATDRICDSITKILEDAGHGNYLITNIPETDDTPVTDDTPDTDEVPDSGETVAPPPEEPVTNAPVTTPPEEPATEPATDAPDTEETVTTPPETEPVTEAPATTPPETEIPTEEITTAPETDPATETVPSTDDPFTDTDAIPL